MQPGIGYHSRSRLLFFVQKSQFFNMRFCHSIYLHYLYKIKSNWI